MKLFRKIAAALTAVLASVAFASPALAAASGSDLSGQADIGTSFEIMGKGMLGIFIVMLIILLVIVLLNVITKPKKSDDAK